MRWDLARIAEACRGTAVGEATVRSVTTDSRAVGDDAVFVAVRGENHDGHRFISDAVTSGAVAVVAERGRLPVGVAGIEVDDTIEALRRMAIARRKELAVPVVAVTGSSGKTTTKDLTGAVLGIGAHTSPHSYNNEFGVPLTLLATPDDATALVVEVGSRGPGHIAHLAEAILPDVAVITNVGRAHLEMFGTVDRVIEAKWELVDALGPEGIAVLPAADDRLASRRSGGLITFGEAAGADVDARDVVVDDSGRTRFVLHHEGVATAVTLRLPGRHQPVNGAAAVAAAVAVGEDFETAAGRLAAAEVSPWRMELAEVPFGSGSIVIVNDSYNANPDSMAAALATVAEMPGRHFAVLGKMHELGEFEVAAHREAGEQAAALGFRVLAVGEDPGLATGAGEAATAVADAAAAVDALHRLLEPGDVVLIKASRAAGLEAVAAAFEDGAS